MSRGTQQGRSVPYRHATKTGRTSYVAPNDAYHARDGGCVTRHAATFCLPVDTICRRGCTGLEAVNLQGLVYQSVPAQPHVLTDLDYHIKYYLSYLLLLVAVSDDHSSHISHAYSESVKLSRQHLMIHATANAAYSAGRSNMERRRTAWDRTSANLLHAANGPHANSNQWLLIRPRYVKRP